MLRHKRLECVLHQPLRRLNRLLPRSSPTRPSVAANQSHHARCTTCAIHRSQCTMHDTRRIMRHAIMHDASCIIRSCIMHDASCTMCGASCRMHDARCTTHHAPCTIYHASYTMCYAPCEMHNAPCMMHERCSNRLLRSLNLPRQLSKEQFFFLQSLPNMAPNSVHTQLLRSSPS